MNCFEKQERMRNRRHRQIFSFIMYQDENFFVSTN